MNLQLATQHASQQFGTSSVKTTKKGDEQKEKSESGRRKKFKKSWRPYGVHCFIFRGCTAVLWSSDFVHRFKLKNVDRSSGQAREITINNLTIRITEYKVKDKRGYVDQLEHSSTSEMSSQSESGFDTSSTVATHSSNKTSHSLLWH